MNKAGERIRQRREELGMSQEELARKIGYRDRSSVAKWENGSNNLKQSMVVKLAKALQCSPIWLMCLENDKEDIQECFESILIHFHNEDDKNFYNKITRVMADEKKRKMLMGLINTLAEE